MKKTIKVDDIYLTFAGFILAKVTNEQKVLGMLISHAKQFIIHDSTITGFAIAKDLGITHGKYRAILVMLNRKQLIRREKDFIILNKILTKPFDRLVIINK